MKLLKGLLNRSMDVLFAGALFDPVWIRRLNGKAVCLCYHRVEDPKDHAFLTDSGYPAITPEVLKSDILYLKSKGFRFITFKDLKKRGALDPDRPHAIVTFDDCFKNNYTHGLTALREAGVPAVFFQVTGIVDSESLLWEQAIFWHCHEPKRARHFEELARAVLPDDSGIHERSGLALAFYLVEDLSFDCVQKVMQASRESLNWDGERILSAELYPAQRDIEAAHQTGHEIGSHGHLHYKRVNVSAEVFERDLVLSVEKLRSWTGEPPLAYAYPHGNFTKGDEMTCAKYFGYAATVRRGIIDDGSDPMELPRFYWAGPPKSALRRKRWLLTGIA